MNKQTAKTETTEKKEATYAAEDFISNSYALGYAPEVVAGALYGVKRLTEAEAKQAVKDYLKKPKKDVEDKGVK